MPLNKTARMVCKQANNRQKKAIMDAAVLLYERSMITKQRMSDISKALGYGASGYMLHNLR